MCARGRVCVGGRARVCALALIYANERLPDLFSLIFGSELLS